ncbi:BamA/OMP85 family outer membrane protein [Bdellovibrio svalbardensis]|uniref:BamA/TamA family outer membrane protein n=1 Tax=Bdellovibrio svalbardensis TaxID=2972972 RepID=A0ABT6DH10_9BACT|nr:outer membrane protein assembly factor [Bdellovibrio svalbardensis]MDG0816088.1 BamA/TamA family outer membrane protein [Bdellovibrio svalbardensis]
MIFSSRALTLSAALLITLGTCSAWAKKNIDLSNFPAEVRADIYKRFPQAQNDRIGLDQVDEIIRFIQLRPDFDRLQVLDSGNVYKVTYIKTKRIGEVQFQGLKYLSKSEAANYLAIKSGDVFDQQTLIDQGEKLRQSYKDLGFFNAVIDIEMPPREDGNVDIHVKVTENKRTLVANIILQSANQELNKSLAIKLEKVVDDPLTDKTLADINKRARDFLTKEHYVRADLTGPTISYSKDEAEATLTYRLERVEKYAFEFKGIYLLSERKIKNAIDLDTFYSANPTIGAELAQKIRAYYLAEGYARAEVNQQEVETNTPFFKKIVFEIDEGPRIKIQDIVINGKFSRKPAYYSHFIKTHSSEIVDKGYFNKDDLDTGVRNLALQLQNEGYLQTKIVSTRFQYNRDKTEVTLFVNLTEGPLTVIKAVEFSGNSAYSNEQLLKVTSLNPGPLKLSQIEAAVSNIKNYYKNNGYIEMQLLNEKEDLVTYDETSTQAILHFKIFEGPQVRAASIVIEGNNFTKDYVILKELDVEPGQLITPQKIEDSITHLQRTGFFSTIEVRTLEEKTTQANRTVLVKVTERDPGLFTVGAGATNERTFTLRGYTSIAYRNLLGTGRGLSLRLEGNYNVTEFKYLESKIVLGYLEPYLFDTKLRGRINITRSSQITDYNVGQITDVNSYTYSLEKDLTTHILGTYDVWSMAQVKDYGLDERYPYQPTRQDIVTTGPNVDFDYRDNPFTPTRGTFTRVTAEYSDPVIGSTETIKYWRAVASFTHYWHVDRWQKQPVVWANQVRGGYLKNLAQTNSNINGVPWDKKGFSLGGTSTVRGYEAGTEYFPNNKDLGIEGTSNKYYLTTDSTMFLIKSELRFPVYGSLGGAAFYDAGEVLIEGLDIKEPYRASTGFGIRYNTPVGPLSVDMAWKLNMQPGESPWRIHLSIGTF